MAPIKTLFLSFAVMVMALTGCASVNPDNLQEPVVTLSNLRPSGTMSLFEQRFILTLRIQNPNNVSIPVEGMNYAVSINGEEFARGSSGDNFTVAALDEKLVDVTVISGPLDWLRQFNKMQSGEKMDLSYKVDGNLYLRGYGDKTLPFNREGRYTAK